MNQWPWWVFVFFISIIIVMVVSVATKILVSSFCEQIVHVVNTHSKFRSSR